MNRQVLKRMEKDMWFGGDELDYRSCERARGPSGTCLERGGISFELLEVYGRILQVKERFERQRCQGYRIFNRSFLEIGLRRVEVNQYL